MSIYEKSVKQLFKEFVKDVGLTPERTFTRKDTVEWFNRKYPKIKQSTVVAHLTMMSTNAPNRIHYAPHSNPDNELFFQLDKFHFRLYRPTSDPLPLRKSSGLGQGATGGAPEEDGEEDSLDAKEFAYERDLKNYLSKNLSIVEPGLRLYEEEGITGIEFPAGNRFIDILAVDKENNYVVIELKVSKGYDRVVGQLLRYMAWIEKNHAEPNQRVRGVIVGSVISEDLSLAASKISDVKLFEYELSLTLRNVK